MKRNCNNLVEFTFIGLASGECDTSYFLGSNFTIKQYLDPFQMKLWPILRTFIEA
jgi:hypothetical protein